MIYTEEFYNYRKWEKTPYTLSIDENNLTLGNNSAFYGRSELKKVDIVPWTKEDIIGSWKTISNNSTNIYTFNENSLIRQLLENGVPSKEIYLEITLTDEYYECTEIPRCYYYFFENKLLLSSGLVFEKYNMID